MKSWTALTDEQRRDVLGMLADAIRDTEDAAPYWAALTVLSGACEARITAEAIASACEECGIHEDGGYGHFPGGDPRDFHPDPECSTDAERAQHRADCDAWDRGDRVERPPACQTTPGAFTHADAAKAIADGAVLASVGPHGLRVVQHGYGLGTYNTEDAPSFIRRLRRERDAYRRDFEAERDGRLVLRQQYGAHEDEIFPAFVARLARERDLARGALVADSHNQRAQLDEYGLADEFVAHIGGDLASGLGEALVVARCERDKLGEQIDILAVATQDAVREQQRAAAAEAREVKLREALVEYLHPSGHARGCALSTLGIEDGQQSENGGVFRCAEFCRMLRTALALPADRTVLDALIAEARCKGARACVEAARTVFDATPSRCGADTSSSLLAAVERAAAGVGPTR